jgi:hypothetical protein
VIRAIPPGVVIAPPGPGIESPHMAHPPECHDVYADTNGDGRGDEYLGCLRN